MYWSRAPLLHYTGIYFYNKVDGYFRSFKLMDISSLSGMVSDQIQCSVYSFINYI